MGHRTPIATAALGVASQVLELRDDLVSQLGIQQARTAQIGGCDICGRFQTHSSGAECLNVPKRQEHWMVGYDTTDQIGW